MEQRVFLFRPVAGERRGQEPAVRAVRRLPAGTVPVQSGTEKVRRRHSRLSAHHIHVDRRRERLQLTCAP